MPKQSPTAQASSARCLLPRPDTRFPLTEPAPLQPRAKSTVAACASCRKYKAKCSGERPLCRRCVRLHIPCVYSTRPGETVSQALSRDRDRLQDRATLYDELFDLLKNLPNREAQNVLQWIRSGEDAATIINHVKAGSALLQMAVVPESRLRYDFPYKPGMPDNLVVDNAYLDTLLYESTQLYAQDHHRDNAGRADSCMTMASSSQQKKSAYLKPFHAAQVVESCLSDANISHWTTVCKDDALMRDLLRVFFRCEYQFTAAFQKDLFLEDLASRRSDFCSPLLVNVVLAYSCVCYPRFQSRARYWDPQSLLYRFLAEAKRLWELQASKPRITTIQAGIIFTVIHNLCGLDEIGKAYRIHAIALAKELRLLDRTVGEGNDRHRSGRAFTAWALYNWESLSAFSFMQPPLLKHCPSWSLPDPSDDPQWYGEIFLEYPLEGCTLPSDFSHVFHARCHFRIIMNEFCDAAYSRNQPISLDEAHALHKQLVNWYSNLPMSLQAEAIVLPQHLQLHVYYHHLLLSIYEPLCDVPKTHSREPKQILADVRRSLQTLIRLYYLRHGFEAMDLFIVIPLMLTAYDCVNSINDQTPESELEDLRSTLILVVQGLFTQRKNHYLALALFRVIRGRMRPQELALLKNVTTVDEDDVDTSDQQLEQPVRSHWPVSVVKKREDIDSHILTNLVRTYAQSDGEEGRPL